MRRAPLLLLVVPLAAFSLVACGDDDDEPSDTATDVTTEEITDETTEETTEETTDGTDAEISTPDISISIPDISTPDISISIPDIDITIPDVSVPDAEELLTRVFPELDEEQISCLVDAFEGERPTVDRVMDLIDECNINVTDLVPG